MHFGPYFKGNQMLLQSWTSCSSGFCQSFQERQNQTSSCGFLLTLTWWRLGSNPSLVQCLNELWSVSDPLGPAYQCFRWRNWVLKDPLNLPQSTSPRAFPPSPRPPPPWPDRKKQLQIPSNNNEPSIGGSATLSLLRLLALQNKSLAVRCLPPSSLLL